MEDLLQPWRSKFRAESPYYDVKLEDIPALLKPDVHLDHSIIKHIVARLTLPTLIEGRDLLQNKIKEDLLEKEDLQEAAFDEEVLNQPRAVSVRQRDRSADDFDCITRQHNPSIEILDVSGAYHYLLGACLGHESKLFSWHAQSSSLKQSDDDVAISGLSPISTNAILGRVSQYGTNLRRISTFAMNVLEQARKYDSIIISFAAFLADFATFCQNNIASHRVESEKCHLSLLEILEVSQRPLSWLALLTASIDLQAPYALIDLVERELRMQFVKTNHHKVVYHLLLLLLQPYLLKLSGTLSKENHQPVKIDSLSPDLMSSILPVVKSTVESVEILKSSKISQSRHLTFFELEQLIDAITVEAPTISRLQQATSRVQITREIISSRKALKAAQPMTQTRTKLIIDGNHPLLSVDTLCRKLIITPLLEFSDHITTSVRSLFVNDLKLREHLEVLRQVFLLGNANLLEALSLALFVDKDSLICLESSALSYWPPNPSSVNIATKHILQSCIQDPRLLIHHQNQAVDTEILGYVSFAFADEEYKTLSRDSPNAASFLKFKFRAQAPLDKIITEESIVQYNRVNGFLILLLRCKALMNRISRSHRESRTKKLYSPSAERFIIEAIDALGNIHLERYGLVQNAHCSRYDAQ